MATLPETMPDPAMRPVAAQVQIERRPGLAARFWRMANRPWASGLAGFLTTAMVLLPVEYEAALRSALLFFSVRRL